MAVLSVVVALVLLRCSAAVPQLYPFGAEVGDSVLTSYAYVSSRSDVISLNISNFPFFDELYSALSVNSLGYISLEQIVYEYLPRPLPLNRSRLIAPYLATTDTYVNTFFFDNETDADRGSVWYRETSNAELLSRAQKEIHMAFVNQRSFKPASLFIATWDTVDYYDNDYYDILERLRGSRINRRNTFQCVMVTDGIQSFVLFLYEDIQWTSSEHQGGTDGLGGHSPALAGINAGDGIRSYTIPGSLTDDIINITETSNVGVPGLWIFRVDQEDIAVGGCSSDENTPLLFAPRSGSVLGGTAVQIGGPCFEQSHRIVCIFDSQEVEGVVVNEMMAVCITPPLTNHGRREFQLMVLAEDGSLVYSANSFFNSLSIEDGPTLIVDYTEPLLLPKNQLNIQWSISRLIPLNNSESFKVDICLYEFDLEEGSWREMAVLKRNTANDGRESVFIPGIAAGDRVIPVALQISSSLKQELPTANDNRSLAWGHVIFYSSTKRDNLLKSLCVNWFQNQPAGIGEALLDRLPSCAPTISRVRLKSVFSEDTGQRRRANQLFHPHAERCFRQTVFTEDNQGSGQQCCYDNDGNLITGDSMDAGSVDMIAPVGLQETWAHFQEDVLPLVFCCLGFECNTYHTGRPSDKGEDCPIIPPACVYGDPHIVTLDGLKYTFNGKGEFILIETEDNSFELQGRMVPANDRNGTEVQATVFSAIVGKEVNSDTVQFQISSVRGIDFLVNGELIVFDELEEQEFTNVTVKNEGNDSLSASFSSGARFEVRVENEIISVVLVSMPDVYQGMLSGLMGNFDGNTSDDLIPRFSTDQLPVNASIEDVHSFGITWIIDNPADSLFTYRSGQNWTTFYDPDFLPVFATVFNDPELLTAAEELCGDDQFCLYDVAATRRTDIGLTTLMGNLEFEEIVELAMPIVCDPPCVNGACVSNNTCNCAPEFTGQLCTEPIICEPRCENGVCVANNTCNCTAGYEGPQCTVPIVMECDDNPCQSGGTCTQSASFIICECPDGFTGDLCEIPPAPTNCVEAGYTSCCVFMERGDCIINQTSLRCYCNQDCYFHNDCCEDVEAIGCTFFQFEFESEEYTVSEGEENVEVCVLVSPSLDRPYRVTINTAEDTSAPNPATDEDDFVAGEIDVVLPPSSSAGRSCVNITIIDDLTDREGNEQFIINFTSIFPDLSRNRLPRINTSLIGATSETVVTILDDEITDETPTNCVEAGYTSCCAFVEEGDCITTNQTSLRCFCNQDCYFFNDCCEDVEAIGCPFFQFEFESEEYTVSEGEGSVEVCVLVSSFLDSAYRVTIKTAEDASAPNPATDEDDFVAEEINVVLPRSSSAGRSCVNITIIDDLTDLEGNEQFIINFTSILPDFTRNTPPQINTSFIGTTSETVVTILDDDITDEILVPCYASLACSQDSLITTTPFTAERCCLQDGLSFELNDTCMPCIVVGWNQTLLQAQERQNGYRLQVLYIKGGSTAFRANVQITQDTAGAQDFSVSPTTLLVTQQSRQVQINFQVDSVAYEPNETFSVMLVPTTAPPTGPNVFFVTTANFEIIDMDVVSFFFTEDDYRATEAAGTMRVVLTKDLVIARDITLTVTPQNLTTARTMGIDVDSFSLPSSSVYSPIEAKSFPEDRVDYSSDVITITYTADEQNAQPNEQTVAVMLTEDAINEANVEVFFVLLALSGDIDRPEAIDLSMRNASVCRISDDDGVVIGFENATYTFNETETLISNEIFLVKQGGVISEQTFLIALEAVDASPSTVRRATRRNGSSGGDYVFESTVVTFGPDETRIAITSFEIVPDNTPEGTEAFQLNSTYHEDGPSFASPTDEDVFRNVFVFIMDDDVIELGFETNYTVEEGDGDVEVCAVVTNPTEEEDLVVTIVAALVTIAQTADEEDFVPIADDPFVMFNQQMRRSCINVTIIDDAVLEQTESFSIRLMLFDDSGSIVAQPDTTTITIPDNDVVTVRFVEPVYTVMESDGRSEVCLTKDLETSTDIAVPYLTMDNTAIDGSDYTRRSGSVLLGSEADSITCIQIPLIIDSTVEAQESFFVILDLPETNASILRGNPGQTEVIITDVLQAQVNDSLVGDPLITVPILVSEEDLLIFNVSQLSLCYEVHGVAGGYFNLISDQCTSVNGLYSSLNQSQFLNVITELGVRAVDDSGTCKNIEVNVQDCEVVIDGVLLNGSRYRSEGISVRRVGNRVRISVPNCNELTLVMWAICTTAERFDPSTRMLVSGEALDFHIMRGLNFGHSAAHGLIGQFWNRPIRVVPFTGLMRDGSVAPENTFEIRITTRTRDDLVLRMLTGILEDLVWDGSDGPCLYVGNQQAGPVYEVENPNDPVIEGVYKDYRVPGLFEESRYIFAQFNETQCV